MKLEMKKLILLSLIAIISGSSCIAVPIKDSSEAKFELDRTKEVVLELEAAFNGRSEPKITARDVSAVAELVARLDEQTLGQVDQSDRLVSTLFHAVKSHSDQTEGLSWLERCNDDCTGKVVKEFMKERRTLVSFFEDYKDLAKSYANRLIDSLLAKPGADVLSEHIIRMAFVEYESLINSLKFICKGEPISSDLSLIDKAAFYKNRLQGRAMGAMLERYRTIQNRDRFADYFKEDFYIMLHVNGYGVYNHAIINVESTIDSFGKFVYHYN